MYAYPNAFYPYLIGHKKHIATTRGSDILVDYKLKFNYPKNIKEKAIFYILRSLLIRSLNHSRYICSTSTSQQKIIFSFLKNKDKSKVIRTGIDATCFISELEKSLAEKNCINIVSIRAMAPLYNIDKIVEAYHLLKKSNAGLKTKLILIDYYSSGEYVKQIKELVIRLGLENDTSVLANLSFSEMARLYKNSDLIIMIPESDGTPVTGIESMIAKKPIIVGKAEYDAELFNNETVWKIDTNDPETLSRKMIEILKLPSGKILEKTEKAFQNAKRLGEMHIEMNKMKRLYEELAAST